MRNALIVSAAAAAVSYVAFGLAPMLMQTEYTVASAREKKEQKEEEAKTEEKKDDGNHITTPEGVKAIYMTSWVAGTPSLRSKLVDLIDSTEVNAVVLDIKDDTGKVSYLAQDPAVASTGSTENRVSDMQEFIASLHEKGIYVIGRVAVFQDPYLAPKWTDQAVTRTSTGGVWKDRKGLSWIDAGSRKYWEYIAALARDAHSIGFDEINFDYIRYPTDGQVSDMTFPISGTKGKRDVVRSFYEYIGAEMRSSGIVSSGDIFGLVTTAHEDMSDGIGQMLEDALANFDYVYPMVYPSHFYAGSYGYNDPNEHPYEIIKVSMGTAVERAIAMVDKPVATPVSPGSTTTVMKMPSPTSAEALAMVDKLRPWLQDFDYGADYDAADVRAQIKATYDVGLDSWLMWNASNKYTVDALLVE